MISRRDFIKMMVANGFMMAAAPQMLLGKERGDMPATDANPGNVIRLALIGKGIQGTGDTNTALRVEGVKLVAVCDLYDARLEQAKSQWPGVDITKDYKEILARKDVDAVIVATPDHWHKEIAIEAMEAGKHVYCEKPVIHKIGEGKAMIEAQARTGKCFYSGSQGMSSLGNRKARQIVRSGIIGKVNFVDGQFTSAPKELGVYNIPADASPQTLWWDRFLGNAPKADFDPQKFFYWRNWKNYGTGIAGDLFVHVISSLHYIMGTPGPEKVYTTGGIRYYTDGCRDMPDVMLGYFDYADRGLGAYTVQLGANYADGVSKKWGSMNFRIVGSEGTIDMQWNKVTVKTFKTADVLAFEQLEPLGNRIDTPVLVSDNEVVMEADQEYKGGHYDHFRFFFESIRNGTRPISDVVFGVQAAIPALLSYESYRRGEAIHWNPEMYREKKK